MITTPTPTPSSVYIDNKSTSVTKSFIKLTKLAKSMTHEVLREETVTIRVAAADAAAKPVLEVPSPVCYQTTTSCTLASEVSFHPSESIL